MNKRTRQTAEQRELRKIAQQEIEDAFRLQAFYEDMEEPKEHSHNETFSQVHWLGEEFKFNSTQATIIEALWKGWEDNQVVHENSIAETIGTAATKYHLRSSFFHHGKYHPAWKKMIKRIGKGLYTLLD